MENVFSVSKPFLNLLTLCGLFPISFIGKPRNGVLKTTWSAKLLSSFMFASTFIVAIFNVILSHNGSFTRSEIVLLSWSVSIKLESLSNVYILLNQVRKRNNIVKFLQIIHQADETVSKNRRKFPKNY